MTCQHDDYELTAEDFDFDELYNVIYQHFVCLECGAIGERTYRMPIKINWNGNQQKLPLEEE